MSSRLPTQSNQPSRPSPSRFGSDMFDPPFLRVVSRRSHSSSGGGSSMNRSDRSHDNPYATTSAVNVPAGRVQRHRLHQPISLVASEASRDIASQRPSSIDSQASYDGNSSYTHSRFGARMEENIQKSSADLALQESRDDAYYRKLQSHGLNASYDNGKRSSSTPDRAHRNNPISPVSAKPRGSDSGDRGNVLQHIRGSPTSTAHGTDRRQGQTIDRRLRPVRRNSIASVHDELSTKTIDDLDNFERAQLLSEDAEDTYLMDEDRNDHRHPQERMAAQSLRQENSTEKPRSYTERRKNKHTIKYHTESVEDYQLFILVFAKALLTFGSPSHRIEAQLNSLAKVFEIEAQFHHTPGVIQVSFGNPEDRPSETCLIKASVGLSLSRIHAAHNIYRAVLHDDQYASEGTSVLRKLLKAPPRYNNKIRYALAYISSFLICGIAFGGSLNDMWVSGLMGLLARFALSIASKSDLSASGSEVFTAAIVSLSARALASATSQIWCFDAISSSGIISLLPGHLILSGSLDIAGKNPALGAPKIVSGIMTSLYLGFGLTLGSDIFLFLDRSAQKALRKAEADSLSNIILQGYYVAQNSTGSGIGDTGNGSFTGSFTFINGSAAEAPNIVQGCYRDPHWKWYLQPLPFASLFFLVPVFALCSSMNSQQHWWSRQTTIMVSIACTSFWITRLCNITFGLETHPDYVSLIGSSIVGLLGNGYSRRFGGTAFTIMLTGIILLVPDGLAAAGGLSQNYQNQSEDEYTQSLTLARKMISVIIGILTGVYSSAAVIYLFGKKKNAALVTF